MPCSACQQRAEFDVTDEIKFIIACALGATVRVLRNDSATLVRKLVEVLSGMAVAYYFGTGIMAHWAVDPALSASLGFVIGLVGMELCGLLITLVDNVLPGVVRDILRRRFGLGGDQ